jgi:hypothetical protein
VLDVQRIAGGHRREQTVKPLVLLLGLCAVAHAAETESLRVRLVFGQRTAQRREYSVQLLAGSAGLTIADVQGVGTEPDDVMGERSRLHAGAGDWDAIDCDVAWPKPGAKPREPHSIWRYLFEHGTPGQVQRLLDDPGLTPDAPVLTVQLAEDGTRGFSVGLAQLARHGAMWLPEYDVFITRADAPVDFAAHLASLKGERVLDRVRRGPEATRADFTAQWEDIGNPERWIASWQTHWLGTTGHLVGTVARHGALYKFGVDRWANVRPDFASPHQFRFDLRWPGCKWAGQRILNGLPIVATTLERDGQRAEVEQFAAPLDEAPPPERGKIASVFCTRIQITGPGPMRLGFHLATENKARHPELREMAGRSCIVDRETGAVWLMIEPGAGLAVTARAAGADDQEPGLEFDCVGPVAAGKPRVIVLKLASPVVAADHAPQLAALAFARARAATVQYWEDWLAQGAQFEVPEPAVNELFRANLWHALMLPRFRDHDHVDLPYSNFAYGQFNADWPINQAVYVDYMLYGLRGHFAVAEKEFAAMFRSQQKPDGRIGGYAEWGVYSPGMLYAIGQNFLLSGDRASFERLLPASLKALDWCLAQVAHGQSSPAAPGLIVAPLNDLTHDARAWGFPNAYFVAGLDVFGRALAAHGHVRADEVKAVANKLRADVEREFARASVKSPVVQLADGTWNNYVPCDALTPRRLLEQWYPTDVDSGPLHLARLGAIDPRGWLTTAMLHDHEDNLFLHQGGAANEPVYNQQATAYLLRDEPEAAIRAFYSMMACAFSHHQFSPLEHRWAWGQYYCPPSTDGAWFELYRNLLVRERADGTLLLAPATPRAWLADGRRITVQRAPTYFGPVSFTIASRAAAGTITATIAAPARQPAAALVMRFRHPQKKPIRSVSVNGKPWTDFDPGLESVRLPQPAAATYAITARYEAQEKTR